MNAEEIKKAVNRQPRKLRVAINGFGRIGRHFFKKAYKDPHIDIVAINDTASLDNLLYLLSFDTTYGKFHHGLQPKITQGKEHLFGGYQDIHVFHEPTPEKLPWKKLEIDIVIEASGHFTNTSLAKKHIKAGAKKVLITAPGKGEGLFNYMRGVNDHDYDTYEHHIISALSCTTNSLAPIIKFIHEKYTIIQGSFVTIHAMTGDQRVIDCPHTKDVRRGRTASCNIIPTSSGAHTSLELLFPDLSGKLTGNAIRVPVPTGSLTEASLLLEQQTNHDEFFSYINSICQHHLKHIVSCNDQHLVSSDIIGNECSGIIDLTTSNLINKSHLKLSIWYDNEAGFSQRLVEITKQLL